MQANGTSCESLPNLSCEQVGYLLQRMSIDDLTINLDEGDALALHTASCPLCQEAFYRSMGTNEGRTFNPEVLDHYAKTQSALMSVAEGWQYLLLSCPNLAHAYKQERKERQWRIFRPIGKSVAMAACVALIMGFGWLQNMRLWSTVGPVTRQDDMGWVLKGELKSSVEVTVRTNDQMMEMARNLQRQPELPDVDTLDYATWRDEHESSFAAFSAVDATHKARAVDSDYVEMLMVSGAIWQFYFELGMRADQPLTKSEPTTIESLGKYCYTASPQIGLVTSVRESTLLAPWPTEGQSPGQKYTEAMLRWHDALAAPPQRSEANRALMLFSLRASQYLANTRTAAYLWTKAHPEEAGQLFASNAYYSMAPLIDKGLRDDQLLAQLRQQVVTARMCTREATNWFLSPESV